MEAEEEGGGQAVNSQRLNMHILPARFRISSEGEHNGESNVGAHGNVFSAVDISRQVERYARFAIRLLSLPLSPSLFDFAATKLYIRKYIILLAR